MNHVGCQMLGLDLTLVIYAGTPIAVPSTTANVPIRHWEEGLVCCLVGG